MNMQQKDTAYQCCPCPMPLRPKNHYNGHLIGDAKRPYVAKKQQQQQSRTSCYQQPLPLESLRALRCTSYTQKEVTMHQRGWKPETQSKLEAKMQEPLSHNSIRETELASAHKVPQELHSMQNKEFGSGTITILSDETVGKADISKYWLLVISKVVAKPGVLVYRTKAKKMTSPAVNTVPLLMRNPDKNSHYSSEVTLAKPESMSVVDPKMVSNNVKAEMRNLEKGVLKERNKSSGLTQNGSKAIFMNGSSRKRKTEPAYNSITRAEIDMSVSKRHMLSSSDINNGRLSIPNEESRKTKNGMNEPCDKLNGLPSETQMKSRNQQNSQPLSSNTCSLNSLKHNKRKRKFDDAKDLTENKEPVTIPSKKKGETKVRKVQTKFYPSSVNQAKKVTHHEAKKRNYEVLDSVMTRDQIIMELPAITKRNIGLNASLVTKKTSTNRIVERKKPETKTNGMISHQKKICLRHQGGKQQQIPSTCLNGDVSRIPVAQTNGSRVCVGGRMADQHKKPEHMSLALEETHPKAKPETVSYMLHSHGLCSALCDVTSSGDTETTRSTCRGKVSSCPSSQNPSSAAAVRTPAGSRKDQSKKSASTLQQQLLHLQEDLISAALSRKAAPKKCLLSPKWSNGWKFEGDPFESKVFISSGREMKLRKCYPLMRHEEGDVICSRDCILLKSEPEKSDLPFVAKVAALWENPDDGEMMVSLLWYYRPENTKHGRRQEDVEHEVFASKHKDISFVRCIQKKCYVLTFNEYCRYRKYVRAVEAGVRTVSSQYEQYPRRNRQPPGCIDPDLVFFCRRVYSILVHRTLKNPR